MNRVLIVCMAATLSCAGCGSFFYTGQQGSVGYEPPADHMSEAIRQRARTVDVVADASKPELRIGGDYGQQTMSVGEGASEGAASGVAFTGDMVTEDPRTILLAPFVLPIAVIAGSIAGASGAKVEQQVQKFRESLTDEIAAESAVPISGETIAELVDTRIDLVDGVTRDSDNADVELAIELREIEIATEDEDATVSVSATAVLRSKPGGDELYRKTFDYSERDSLRSWANGDDARWAGYTVNANHYLAAEIAADLFETVHVRNVLRPARTQTFSGGWQGHITTPTPTLAWELFLLGGDEYRDRINRADIRFDLRVFDAGRLIYEARGIEGTRHAVEDALPGCHSLRWSVRPVYRLDGTTRAGEWMSYRSGTDKFTHQGASNPSKPEFWAYYAGIGAQCRS